MAEISDVEVSTQPMTRAELARLWELLGMWRATHAECVPHLAATYAGVTQHWVEHELAERFGG